MSSMKSNKGFGIFVFIMVVVLGIACYSSWKYRADWKDRVKLLRPGARDQRPPSLKMNSNVQIEKDRIIIYLGEMSIPVIKNHKIDYQLAVKVSLSVDKDVAKEVGNRTPVLMNDVRLRLMDVIPTLVDETGKPDEEALQHQIAEEVVTIFEDPETFDVIIDNIDKKIPQK